MGDQHDAIHSFLETFEQSPPDNNIPVTTHRSANCCCGNAACIYLKHNQSALDGLERDVCTAARLGKALLMRHEAYIADSEKERKAMTAHIENLETEKQELERRNATAIEENRSLLNQLENLNNAVAESDTQVVNLQSTLRSTQQELHRLAGLASRTEKLDQQLFEFEREQISWQTTIEEKESAEKTALRRWQQAERTLASLQDQIERIEREAQEEKDRHVEVMGRMERRHAVERELDSAAGRLKGAAAVKNAGTEAGNPNVVSHFVKDILQDNANLQMGIIELRDMLQTSNEEVETLRNQLSLHQPVAEEETVVPPVAPMTKRPHLNEEMRRATASELHVHHHYHAPTSAPTPAPKPRRSRSTTKKKRYGSLTSGHHTPPSGLSTPRYSFSQGPPSTAAAILSQTAASLPESANRSRWSVQSNQSVRDYSRPSSPGSRAPSVFDRVFSDAGHDSSRPTTPDTEEPGSPVWPAWAPSQSKRSSRSSYHRPRPSSSSHRNRPSLDSILDISTDNIRHLEQQQTSEAVIPEEDEHEWENESSHSPERESNVTPLSEELEQALERTPRPQLRRAASHESILSVSAMDIHTLKSRPSQLLSQYGGRSFTPQAVLTDTTALATRPAALSRPSNSGASILSSIAPANRAVSSGTPAAARQGLGSKVGGWVFGRWGASPAPSTAQDSLDVTPKANRAVSIASGSTGRSTEDTQAAPKAIWRPPGINQPGPILGFGPETKLDHPPILKSLDQDALKQVLEEEE